MDGDDEYKFGRGAAIGSGKQVSSSEYGESIFEERSPLKRFAENRGNI